ncbi:5'-nucleotidase C-terminal domain-containing protein [Alteribacillus sp. HJP-4]|uniref:5'-nucleotidase C-terminal domain-containing protein n=1 Tax=Alteribacillus sp. HJP-4 TaxID=2775394 RepID=UPI0035CCE21C
MRKRSKGIIGFGLALSVGAFGSFAAKADAENIDVQLLSLNDWHGQITKETAIDVGEDEVMVGGADYLATHLKEYEADNENTLTVHAGDMIGGSPIIASAFQDQPVVEIMEAMEVDIGTVGNHEFDEGIEEFQRMVEGGDHPDVPETEGYDGMNFPNIAANVYDSSTDELLLNPYHIEEIDGARIGFIGVATTDTPGMVKVQGNENLEVRDELDAINTYADELVDEGISAIVVLAHNPASQQDAEFSNEVVDGKTIAKAEGGTMIEDVGEWEEELHDEVDVIFAGHNHETVNSTIKDDVQVVQAWEYGYAFGAVDIEIDPDSGDIVREATEAEVVYNTHDVEQDPEVAEIIAEYDELIEPIQNEVVGESLYDYESNRYPFNDRAYSDHAIGNLIADSMVWSMESDFGIMNGGGVRAGLNAGEVTFGDLYTIQPFQNMLQKFTVDGTGLREIMNNQITSYGLDYSIAGFQYTYRYDHDAQQGEVVDIMLPDGTPIEDDETYTVTTNDYSFLADNMDDYAIGDSEVGDIDSDVLRDYVKNEVKTIDMKPEGRIMQVGERFNDVPLDNWANPYVFDMSFNGLAKGTSESMFSPRTKITRAQFAYMLTRSLGLEASGDAPFDDITHLAQESQDEIAAAYEAGLVIGTSSDTFEPHKQIKRSQMVTMLMRAYEYENGEAHEPASEVFKDTDHLDEEMAAAVESAYELGYIDGYDGDEFKPNNTATRAQSAKVLSLYRLK